MPTKLTKPVTRETLRTKDRRGRTMIVTLEANEFISFRPKGSKKKISVFLGHCQNLARIFAQQEHYKERMDRYNQRKKLGQRAVRPKKTILPYSRFYYEALQSS